MPHSPLNWNLENIAFSADLPVHAFFHNVQSVDFHMHQATELLLVLSGSILLLSDGKERQIDAGGVALIHSNQVHATQDIGAPNLVLALQIHNAVARHDPHFERRRFDLEALESEPHGGELLRRLRFLMARAMYEIRSKRTAWRMEVESLVLQLIALLVRHVPSHLVEHDDPLFTQDEAKLLGPRLRAAAHYISQHASEPISTSTLAQALGLSSGYLARLFKGEAGTTFSSFITHVRLRRALEELNSSGHARVIDIALDCGFPNVKAFNVAFKRTFSCTPSEWRRARSQTASRHVNLSPYPRIDEVVAMDLLSGYLDQR